MTLTDVDELLYDELCAFRLPGTTLSTENTRHAAQSQTNLEVRSSARLLPDEDALVSSLASAQPAHVLVGGVCHGKDVRRILVALAVLVVGRELVKKYMYEDERESGFLANSQLHLHSLVTYIFVVDSEISVWVQSNKDVADVCLKQAGIRKNIRLSIYSGRISEQKFK